MRPRQVFVAGRPWDSFDGYLFDIDGTLIHCTDAVHYFAFCDALERASGRALTLDGVTAHGNTDIGILRDALRLVGIPEETWRPRLPELCKAMTNFVEAHQDEFRITVLPAVREVLEHLQTRGAILGLATGNLKRIGQAKLRLANLLDYFTVGGWSDDCEFRTEVFRHAIDEMQAQLGLDKRICILGDTPADIQAAHANGVPVIAVATGVYSQEQLLQHAPDLCLQSFSELVDDL